MRRYLLATSPLFFGPFFLLFFFQLKATAPTILPDGGEFEALKVLGLLALLVLKVQILTLLPDGSVFAALKALNLLALLAPKYKY